MFIREGYEVVVVGGGPAGVVAAIAAARKGAKTLLIEEGSSLGGPAAFGMPIHTFFRADGEQIIRGIAQEFVDRLVEIEGCVGHAPTFNDISPTYTLVDPEAVKFISQEMIREAHCDLLLHTRANDALLSEDRRSVRGIVLQHKVGTEVVPAQVVVDCTGDGDIAYLAGAKMEIGNKEGKTQAMTMNFRLAGVDLQQAAGWLKNGISYSVKPWESEETFLRGWGSFGPWEQDVQELKLFHDTDHRAYTCSFRCGELNVNTVKVTGYDSTMAGQWTEAEMEARKRVWEVFQFMKENCPGFENSYLVSTPSQTGIRETRRIVGEYILTEDDVLQGRKFPDVIARSAYPIDIHDPETGTISLVPVGGDGSYDIPYRCLVPIEIEGLIVAGRDMSATHEALGSARVMANCMAMGQAAGVAACMAIEKSCDLRSVPINELQQQLLRDGVNLGR